MNEKVSIAHTVDRDAMADEVKYFNQALAANLEKAFDLAGALNPSVFTRLVWVRVAAPDLYTVFRSALDARTSAEYNCTCCRRFTNDYLTTVIMDGATGEIVHTLFPSEDQVPEQFKAGARAAAQYLKQGSVVGLMPLRELEDKQLVLGVPEAGGFHHFHFTLTSDQAADLKAVNYVDSKDRLTQREQLLKMLVGSLNAHDLHLVKATIIHLQNAFQGSIADRFVHNLEAFVEMKERIQTVTGLQRSRLLNNYALRGNQAVIRMDTGGALLGTLLEMIKNAGENEHEIKQALSWFSHQSNGLRYRRQTAQPADGAIERANKVFAERGLAPSMARRAVPLQEITDLIWQRSELTAPPKTGGFFDEHKSEKPAQAGALPARKRTVRAAILPELLGEYAKLYLKLSSNHHNDLRLIGLATAVNLDAPPLMKWDKEDDRFPFSGYMPSAPTPVADYGLELLNEVRSTGRMEIAVITTMHRRMGVSQSVLAFFVNGHQRTNGGSAIFPESLRADLYDVAKVIDLHSQKDILHDAHKGAVGGWLEGQVLIGVRHDGSEDHLTVVDAE